MEEEKSLIEGYKKWAGDCPTTERERLHWLAGFGAYILGWQDREERLLTPRAADVTTSERTMNISCPACGCIIHAALQLSRG